MNDHLSSEHNKSELEHHADSERCYSTLQMVWEIETECDPGEGAHSWGKKDMVGDVTCLATYRFTIMFLLPLEDNLSTVGECSQAKSRRKRGWRSSPASTMVTSPPMMVITSPMRRAGRLIRFPG